MFNPNANPNNPWRYNQQPTQPQPPIIIDSESEEDDDEDQPGMASYSRPHPSHTRQHPYHPHHSMPIEQEKRIRSRLREERHAALCVLMDRELLTIQALAVQETLPQTRRRFLANLLSPSDPTTAATIRSDQFTIQQPSTSSSRSGYTEPVAVSRSVVDVCESDDNGWYKPVPVPVFSGGGGGEDTLGELGRVGSPSASGSGGASATSSPISSGKLKGRTAGTPERNRAGRRVSSERQQQQQVNRERRRRWSGAERQDYGAGASF
ncbi:uncharacterized protein BDV14DRAFT_144196 [Aspergillus stella-maris]|uniref:uncharacterized protein n=1 Tax=Aspergillus stella-maris TaxID=1810926 RepID=UPI003CCDE0BE